MYLEKSEVRAALAAFVSAGRDTAAYAGAQQTVVKMAYLISERSMPRFRQRYTVLPESIDESDLVQSGVLHVLTAATRWNPANGGSPFGWLTTVIWRHWLGILRSEGQRREKLERFGLGLLPCGTRGRLGSPLETSEARYDAPGPLEQAEDADDMAMLEKWFDGTAGQPKPKRHKADCAACAA